MDAPAMARERLALLRRAIARIEGRPAETLDGTHGRAWPDEEPELPPSASPSRNGGPNLMHTGAGWFDAALGGGLQAAALTELRTDETRHAAALLGFALCLAASVRSGPVIPLLWLSTDAAGRETGLPYLPGICGLAGIAPGRLFTGLGRSIHNTLWIAEEAAASGAFSAIILELHRNPKALGLDETRRLQRRAALSGKPVFLLRVAGMAEPTAAPCRLSVAPAPSVPRRTREGPLEGSIGAPAFTVTVEKARAPSRPPFILEWNPHERYFTERSADSLPRPAASADRPDRPAALGAGVAHGRTA